MKKILITLLFIFFLMINVSAETISRNDIEPSTYIIGTCMFTRIPDEETGYDGTLTTKRIMIASKTISGNNESDMIVYYKTPTNTWINALSGSPVDVPESFEIEIVDLKDEIEIQPNEVDLTDYVISTNNIYSSTYIIGNHMFTRDINKKDNYNGKLNTTKVMLASKTIASNNENDMIIYYKTPNGNWIDALTGETITVPSSFAIETINLRNQIENPYTASLDVGSAVNTKLKKLAGNANATYALKDGNILSIKEVKVLPASLEISDNNVISADDSDLSVYAWYSDGIVNYFVKKYYQKDTKIYLNETSAYLFYRLSNVTSIDLENVDTSQVSNMASMFEECSSLENVNLTNFNTSNVTNMYGLFNNCTALNNINVTNFNTSKVTNVSYMFNKCENIAKLDLSAFDLSKVTDYSNLLYGMSMLSELTTPKVNARYEILLPKTMYDELDNAYLSLTSTTPTMTLLKLPNILTKGSEINAKIKKMAGNTEVTSSTVDENVKAITRAESMPEIELGKENILTLPNSTDPLYMWYDEGTIYYYTEAAKIYLPTEVTYMFANFANLKSIDLSLFDSSQVVYMSYMFYNCTNLLTLNLSEFDLSKVRSATSVFAGDNALISLNTPKVNANVDVLISKSLYDSTGKEYTKLTNELTTSILLESKTQVVSGQIFNEKIKKLAGNAAATYSNFNRTITEVRVATSLPEIELDENNIVSSDDSSRLIYVWFDEGILYYYTEASRIYLNNNSAYMFNNLKSATSIDLSKFNTNGITNIAYMFDGCESLTKLDLSNFDVSKVLLTDYMLNGLTSLTEFTTPKAITNSQTITLPHAMYDNLNTKYEYVTITTPLQTLLKTEW